MSSPSDPQQAIEFCSSSELYNQLLRICRAEWHTNSARAFFPSEDPADLCHEVLVRVAKYHCENHRFFLGLFRKALRNHIISLSRKAAVRWDVVDLQTGHRALHDEWNHEDNSHQLFRAEEIRRDADQASHVTEALRLLRETSVPSGSLPLLDAILVEAETGHRETDREIAERLDTCPSTICRQRGKLRRLLARRLQEIESPALQMPEPNAMSPLADGACSDGAGL